MVGTITSVTNYKRRLEGDFRNLYLPSFPIKSSTLTGKEAGIHSGNRKSGWFRQIKVQTFA